eukprot:SAG22_NODE_311_length_12629_cov_20.911891_7_plen_43_part_00
MLLLLLLLTFVAAHETPHEADFRRRSLLFLYASPPYYPELNF